LPNGAVLRNTANNSVAFGQGAGLNSQGATAIAIGADAGYYTQGAGAVAVGESAGESYQGANAVAIGKKAGYYYQANNSIILNATGDPLEQTTANTFTVAPIRTDSGHTAQALSYNTTTKEITYANVTAGSYSNVQVATYLPTYSGNLTANYANVSSLEVNGLSTFGNVEIPVGDDSYAGRLRCYLGNGNLAIESTNKMYIGSNNANVQIQPGSGQTVLFSAGMIAGKVQFDVPVISTLTTAATSTITGAIQTNGGIGALGNIYAGENIVATGNVIARDVTAGNISASGTSGKIGFTNGGFVQQITANSNGISLNTVTGNIQLMGINLGVNGIHTVSFTNNKLEETDMILVSHHSGGVSNFAVGAYYAAPSTAIIWIRNITGADTSTVTPMLKFALIKAPGS
jgi:hypothetical protein